MHLKERHEISFERNNGNVALFLKTDMFLKENGRKDKRASSEAKRWRSVPMTSSS
jgi:hypothetical protein